MTTGGRDTAQETDQDPARRLVRLGTLEPGFWPEPCAETVNLLSLCGEPGQGQGLDLVKLAEFGALAGDELG